MARRDYADEDEEDSYGQDFSPAPGVASVWVGLEPAAEGRGDVDTLQDLCGVGYYDVDQQESWASAIMCPISELLAPLSRARSFSDPVVAACHARRVATAYWVTVQYDFRYDPAKVKRPVAADPIFVGVFPYTSYV